MRDRFDIVILGLTITSSWGNGHATTFRGLVQGLASRGHNVLFLERDAPWYASNRDAPNPRGAVTAIYESSEDLAARFEHDVREAELVIVGSYVPDGIKIGEWCISVARGRCAFYDIDTPVTLAQLKAGGSDYITPQLIENYDAYLSFAGGEALRVLEDQYGSPMARELYCCVDCGLYQPMETERSWDLGYLGTYSLDRQSALSELLLAPARRWPEGHFSVAGPQYPETTEWPANVERFLHLAPAEHALFYGTQRFTLNVTREAMRRCGYSPSVRLFEAGACGVPVISDWWEGLNSIFKIGEEVLVAETADDILRFLHDIPEAQRRAIGEAARRRVLAEHTPVARAAQLDEYLREMNDHAVTGAARRNGRGGRGFNGLDSGSSPEFEGAETGRVSGGGVHGDPH